MTTPLSLASPSGNGGRGLKPHRRHDLGVGVAASPSGNGGRGLKPACARTKKRSVGASPSGNGGRGLKPEREKPAYRLPGASPSGNGGRGLKHGIKPIPRHSCGIALWKRRAWIETSRRINSGTSRNASPSGNGGRGLKRLNAICVAVYCRNLARFFW